MVLCLLVVGRRSHRLWASVRGAAGGDHLPWGIAGGKNHHELQGQGQSTCYIQVTYVPHKPALITTRWAFCVSPISCHLSGCIHTGLGSACKRQGHNDAYPNLDAPPGVYNVCDRPAVQWLCDIFSSLSQYNIVVKQTAHLILFIADVFFFSLC